jgi:hypothetical protein
VQVSRGKRQTTLPNAWWCAGIRRSARQQERDEAWALYSQSYRGTPKNEGFPTPSAPAASSDRIIGPQDDHIDWAPLGWLVFVESPVEESMRRSILRSNAPGSSFSARSRSPSRRACSSPGAWWVPIQNVARRCGAPRQRRPRPAHYHQDWRRGQGARRSVQRHGRPAA